MAVLARKATVAGAHSGAVVIGAISTVQTRVHGARVYIEDKEAKLNI